MTAGDDATSVRLGLDTLQTLRDTSVNVVVATGSRTALGAKGDDEDAPVSTIGRARLIVFNVADHVYTLESLRDGMYYDMARAAHEAYVAQARLRGETEHTNPSMLPWGKLTPDLQRANIRQAYSVGEKLRAEKLAVVPTDGRSNTFRFEGAELERLAHDEHERWCLERIEAGWSEGPRDNDAKKHPDLVPWASLTPSPRRRTSTPWPRSPTSSGGSGCRSSASAGDGPDRPSARRTTSRSAIRRARSWGSGRWRRRGRRPVSDHGRCRPSMRGRGPTSSGGSLRRPSARPRLKWTNTESAALPTRRRAASTSRSPRSHRPSWPPLHVSSHRRRADRHRGGERGADLRDSHRHKGSATLRSPQPGHRCRSPTSWTRSSAPSAPFTARSSRSASSSRHAGAGVGDGSGCRRRRWHGSASSCNGVAERGDRSALHRCDTRCGPGGLGDRHATARGAHL